MTSRSRPHSPWLKDRKDRVAFLRAQAGVTVFETKLDELLPKPPKKTREGIQNAQLILVTSQEIDELCEQDNIAQARLQMDSVLRQLRRGVRILIDLGIKTLILVADHGHLFADELSEDMKIDPPGGQTEDLHRRVWVGIGGASDPAYLRTTLASPGENRAECRDPDADRRDQPEDDGRRIPPGRRQRRRTGPSRPD